MDLKQIVRKDIAIGVLIGGIFLTGILWFLSYMTEKATAYSELNPAGAFLSD